MPNKSYFAHARVGLFTHYTYPTYSEDKGTNYGGTSFSQTDRRTARSAEEAAFLFDGDKFADAAHDLGAEYVVFTVAHAGFNLLFPSETMMQTGCTHKCAESSDAIRKLLDGLNRYSIPLVLYMPPNDDHDIPDDDLRRLGWYQNKDARMAFHKRLIREIYDRYGTGNNGGIAGFWFDQCGPTRDVCDFVRECDPDAVVFINTGITANTELHPNSDFIVSEYYGSIESCDSDTLPVHYSQVNRQIGGWYAQSGAKAPTDARNLYRYTVRTIAVEGQFNCGIAWSCGPYLDQTWVDGVRELLTGLGDLLRSHEGIYGTVPGRSYVEAPNATLSPDDWGVSTETPDGSAVYLHILNYPETGVLRLPAPADGKTFREAWYGDVPLGLEKTETGYAVTLPEKEACDAIDTVVKLK